MDNVSTIAATVAAGQVPEGSENILALAALTGIRAAPVFVDGHKNHEGNQEETDQCANFLSVHNKKSCCDQQRADDRFPYSAPQRFDGGMPPCRKRRHAHDQQQSGEKRRGGTLVEWRANSHFLTCK